MPAIRGLVAEGILQTTAEYRNSFSTLLRATDVQCFAERYVATLVLARRFHLNSGSLAPIERVGNTAPTDERVERSSTSRTCEATRSLGSSGRLKAGRVASLMIIRGDAILPVVAPTAEILARTPGADTEASLSCAESVRVTECPLRLNR